MKSLLTYLLVTMMLFFLSTLYSYGQDSSQESDTLRSLAPKIYVDCRSCDLDFFRTEITFANFVRDRKLADIHILITTQRTGGGGIEYSVEFIGRHAFQNMVDTFTYYSQESDTEDMVRKGLAKTLKLGLTRYVAKTPLAEYVAIDYTRPSEPMAAVDKWNYWVFQVETWTNVNGEESQRFINFWGEIQAKRVTEQSKTEFSIWSNYTESKFEYNNISTLSLTRSKGTNAEFIWSLGDRWSVGIYASAWSSTFNNIKIQGGGAPAIEYNIYPYDESTRRQLRIAYRIGVNYVDYEEETIFNKYSEWLVSQRLSITADITQPWGSIRATLSRSNYLHDFRKNRLQLNGRLSLRLLEGLSFNIYGGASRIRDQLSLPKGGATEEEIYLRRKELATGYSYWVSLGLSYTFGSIYNNIVNARFGD
jgi:hypothetical protein